MTTKPMNEPYSKYESDPLFAQPANLKGGLLDAFAFVSDPEALAAFVDKRLNAPTGNVAGLKPLFPVVLATFAHYAHAASLTEPYTQRGYVNYHELAFWVFVVATKNAPHAPRGTVFVWNPYLYVDDHLALIGGREIYGFDKKMGVIRMPGDKDPPSSYSVTTIGHTEYVPENESRELPVMTVTASGETPAQAIGETFDNLGALVTALLGELGHGGDSLEGLLKKLLGDFTLAVEVIAHVLQDILTSQIPGITLKQMRSALDPERSDLKLLLNGVNQIQKLSAQLLLGHYDVTLPHSASEPIARDLGLSTTPSPILSFRVKIDGLMGNATQIWP